MTEFPFEANDPKKAEMKKKKSFFYQQFLMDSQKRKSWHVHGYHANGFI